MIPTPPAQIQTIPAPRPMEFKGSGGLTLRGTVLAGKGSPWFAVLVSDSGPLDRDWNDPRLPNHGGRILAEWLRDQGLGSFRFDKRMAGSRDPHLNTSLDAQVGDIRAAIQTAKDLPEAKGKRILLVGHGEGAMLGLVGGQEADAFLLLAMPSEPMAKTILDEVSLQMPAEKAGDNLAFLRSVFQAIRDGKPAPKAGAGIYPSLAKLGASLMAPETLDFVRETLDLDPMAMACRTAVPTALVWGEKDIQAWMPRDRPKTFHGEIMDIKDANHFFRKEPRSRAELDGKSALEGYLDDRPLADLSAVGDWIRALP